MLVFALTVRKKDQQFGLDNEANWLVQVRLEYKEKLPDNSFMMFNLNLWIIKKESK